MSILLSNEILEAVKKELESAIDSVRIITAYCKENTLKQLNSYIDDSVVDKKLLVRFRMDDVVKGSTDFDILKYAKQNGWKVYIRFDLHAKTYVVDNIRGIIGSANATNSGFGIGKSGNMEMATMVDIEKSDIEKIDGLFSDAIYVNDSIYDILAKQMKDVNDATLKNSSFTWDKSIIDLFRPTIKTLFSYELPNDFEMAKGEYFSFMDAVYDGNIEHFREEFRWCNAYLWLKNLLKINHGSMYFGAISVEMHNSLISDPKPYRKDVKIMLANLLKLIETLDMGEITIDKPNYSQRVTLHND